MISDNVQYEMKEPLVLKLMGNNEKRVPNGTYTIRELNPLVERKFILTDFLFFTFFLIFQIYLQYSTHIYNTYLHYNTVPYI